jgi:hypothetical protein
MYDVPVDAKPSQDHELPFSVNDFEMNSDGSKIAAYGSIYRRNSTQMTMFEKGGEAAHWEEPGTISVKALNEERLLATRQRDCFCIATQDRKQVIQDVKYYAVSPSRIKIVFLKPNDPHVYLIDLRRLTHHPNFSPEKLYKLPSVGDVTMRLSDDDVLAVQVNDGKLKGDTHTGQIYSLVNPFDQTAMLSPANELVHRIACSLM